LKKKGKTEKNNSPFFKKEKNQKKQALQLNSPFFKGTMSQRGG
jgi:hypothetical protein